MTAARKLNDTMAVTIVNLAVSSIGSSPFRLEGCPFRNRVTLPAPLGECQAVSLLRRTMNNPPDAEANNAFRDLLFHHGTKFFAGAKESRKTGISLAEHAAGSERTG
jgi:hypothetical protein